MPCVTSKEERTKYIKTLP